MKTQTTHQILAEYEVSLIYEGMDPQEIFLLGFLKALKGDDDNSVEFMSEP